MRQNHYLVSLNGGLKLRPTQTDVTATVVEAIKKVGPRNSTLISRITGIPTETVRYKINKQLTAKGFRIHVIVDVHKLAMKRQSLVLDFSDDYREIAPQILESFNQLAYLIYYGRTMPKGEFITLVTLPTDFEAEYVGFLDGLVKMGMLRSYDRTQLEWIHYHSFRPEYFDFPSKSFDIDWQRLGTVKVRTGEDYATTISKKPIADYSDLLILKELQINSLQSIVDISRKVKIHPKTLRYHYNQHILRRKLVSEYGVRWMGDIESTRRHAILYMRFFVRDASSRELALAQDVFLRLPFVWSDALSEDSRLYMVEVSLPISQYIDMMEYVTRKIGSIARKLDFIFIDRSATNAFTTPYHMFREGAWVFNPDDSLERFSRLAMEIDKIKK